MLLHCASATIQLNHLSPATTCSTLHHRSECAGVNVCLLCSLTLCAVLYCVLLKASHPELVAAAAAGDKAPKQLHSAADVVAAARKKMSATWQQGVAHMGPGLQVGVVREGSKGNWYWGSNVGAHGFQMTSSVEPCLWRRWQQDRFTDLSLVADADGLLRQNVLGYLLHLCGAVADVLVSPEFATCVIVHRMTSMRVVLCRLWAS